MGAATSVLITDNGGWVELMVILDQDVSDGN